MSLNLNKDDKKLYEVWFTLVSGKMEVGFLTYEEVNKLFSLLRDELYYFIFKKQDKTIIIPHDSIDKIEIRGWDD